MHWNTVQAVCMRKNECSGQVRGLTAKFQLFAQNKCWRLAESKYNLSPGQAVAIDQKAAGITEDCASSAASFQVLLHVAAHEGCNQL